MFSLFFFQKWLAIGWCGGRNSSPWRIPAEEFLLNEVLLSASKDDKTKVQIFQEKKNLLCPYSEVNSD